MISERPIQIIGAVGSPYSRKMRALLRYRRIPHVWIHQGWPESKRLPKPRVELLPQLILPSPDGALEARVDSTPLIRELEERYSGRSVIPPDPALAFVDTLLEDFADEWVTKAMFHYRWAFVPDIANAAAILPRWFRPNQPESQVVAAGEMFAKRQIERLWVVGSNPTTAVVIEQSYRRLLACLDAHLTEFRFVLGGRPGTADFALFGQLSQLVAFDPTPAAIAHEVAPRVVAWVDVVDDLSGVDPKEEDWFTRDTVPETMHALLVEVGRVYVPFLLANAEALEKGVERVECTIEGQPWVQRPFPYQGKCLRWLREGYAALAGGDRSCVDSLIAGTGCERLFSVP